MQSYTCMIFLTTVTDIVGFGAFLGFANLALPIPV